MPIQEKKLQVVVYFSSSTGYSVGTCDTIHHELGKVQYGFWPTHVIKQEGCSSLETTIIKVVFHCNVNDFIPWVYQQCCPLSLIINTLNKQTYVPHD